MPGDQKRERAYLIMTLLTLVLVGGGLITAIYGLPALLTSLPFLLLGALLLLGLWWIVSGMSAWRRKQERAELDAAARHVAQLQRAEREESQQAEQNSSRNL